MTLASAATDPAPRPQAASTGGEPVNRLVVAAALALLALLGVGAFRAAGAEMALLLVIGAGLGVSLYHAAFGFTGSWRAFLTERRGAGLRAQMLMLAVAITAFLPILDQGSLFGQGVRGAIAPVGVSVVAGSFLFGLGMQLGGACASGTLFTAGGGSTRMLATLAFFLVGSLLGSLHIPWWLDQPRLGSLSLQGELGLVPALILSWAVFGGIAIATVIVERRAHGRLVPRAAPTRHGWRRVLQGPWPLAAGALALAGLNLATLSVSGHPWSVSFGYTLWGAKAASALGLDVASWSFWTWPYPKAALEGSLLAEDTSVMNFGIIAGALLAAGLAGKFAPSRRVAWKLILASAVGGILMGYGARLAFGCNIGALFSGIASGSLHGWLWLVCALLGNALGVRLRPLFGMTRA
jgi:hypothetical protein